MEHYKEKMGIVGFMNTFSKCPYNIPEEGGVLKFDKGMPNVNNCYNPTTGRFTAHKTGIYSFYLSGVVHSNDKQGYTDLVLEKANGHPLQRVFLRGNADRFDHYGGMGSGHVRVRLDRGEQVQVRHLQGDLGLSGHGHTKFSGVLEYEYTDCVPAMEVVPPSPSSVRWKY